MILNREYRVTSLALNIRKKPDTSPSTKIATLPQGHVIEVIALAKVVNWVEVKTVLDGTILNGFVHQAFLQLVEENEETELFENIAEVHLSKTNSNSNRGNTSSRAFPLFEINQPERVINGGVMEVNNSIYNIVHWLNVETSLRYLPANGSTFCNIYAYDFCYLAKVYLPRVWWTERGLNDLIEGQNIMVRYGETVNELNANSLFDWLRFWGGNFGWKRIFDLNELQNAVNQGKIGFLVAKRKQLNRSGHITVALPETIDKKARRVNGNVTSPLQSQAGATNNMFFTNVWWTNSKFQDFGFWICN